MAKCHERACSFRHIAALILSVSRINDEYPIDQFGNVHVFENQPRSSELVDVTSDCTSISPD